ncbi:branched-chain amino acid ABC transporter permease [candidate division KSB3 bacterium]|uniref:Branched-chain amino acid ABC transporter permease n=1 Tax=candidate division KSB3 bacterium TaxID=2044937 RepID=A0A9D5Q5G2_9BACT|nr:branched-chain amino acid ABC transporter permease [candidate division KSB3 bacterium]MBD3324585.1 branched-chain amino acid ABC transporter permease [candidate division KSB3 bacterium]
MVGFVSAVLITVYAILFLIAESERAVVILLVVGAAVILAASRLGYLQHTLQAFRVHERLMHGVALLGVLVVTGFFYEDHYVLFLIATILLYILSCLGLHIQLGYAGVLNFSGAAFFGIGSYTAAVLTVHTGTPHLLILLIGGLLAALIGSILILPLLRTSGHYTALITIAFSILFKTFLEVNDTLGGPQGLRVEGLQILGLSFNDNIMIGEHELSFFLNYILLTLILVALAFLLTKRLERSWIGLNMDAVRLDETVSACFGLDIARWKILAFTLGNILPGIAGAIYGTMIGFIAPTNFTFADSLILLSIILLGGIGNPWGLSFATVIVVILPEKLQVIQEYRFLLYAALVILVLRFRPDGLLPRQLRTYLPGGKST